MKTSHMTIVVMWLCRLMSHLASCNLYICIALMQWFYYAAIRDVNETRLARDSKKILQLQNYIFRPLRILRVWMELPIKSLLFSSELRSNVYHGLQSTDANWVGQEEAGCPPLPVITSTVGPQGVCWTEHLPVFKAANVPHLTSDNGPTLAVKTAHWEHPRTFTSPQ